MPVPLPADHPVRRGVRALLTQRHLTRSRAVEAPPVARPASAPRTGAGKLATEEVAETTTPLTAH